MSTDDPQRPNTLPGFPQSEGSGVPSAPVLVHHAKLAVAPTELAMAVIELDREALSLAHAVQEGAEEAVLVIDPGGAVHVLSQGAPIVDRLGHKLSDLLEDPASYFEDNDDIRLLAVFRSVRSEPGKRVTVRFSCRDATGTFVGLEARLHHLSHEAAGAIVIHVRAAPKDDGAAVSTRHDNLPQLERVEDRDSFIAHTQRVIDRKVQKVWSAPPHARAVMRDRRWEYTLVLIYLDRFNILLGGFGADVLTELCIEACSRIRTVLRSPDSVAPVGATEIAVLLEGVSDAAHIRRLTELALGTLRETIEVGGQPVSLVPIAGIASSTRRYEEASELLQDAAAAAGRALMSGLGAETFQTEFRTETVHRMSLMADLQEGIERGELFLLYQPLYSLRDQRCTALEAFVRWRHPKHGLVMPGDFIPMAEETGLIRPLTEWVLAAGCGAMVELAPDGPLRLHVNVGAQELSDRRFFGGVMKALETSKLQASRLCLDMSESALVDGSEVARDTMHRLGAKSVRFALDDYGTGASSLRYLSDLPFDFVKIDTSISQQVDDTQRRIAKAMIGLAHELDRQVIAEGVESETQKSSLAELGSDEAQGYFFSKPLPREEIEKVI